jgi:hypothetical protein
MPVSVNLEVGKFQALPEVLTDCPVDSCKRAMFYATDLTVLRNFGTNSQ